MATSQGQINQANYNSALIPVDMSDFMFNPELGKGRTLNEAAIFVLSKKLGKHKTVSRIDFKLADDTFIQREFPIATLVSVATATPLIFTVAAGLQYLIRPRDQLLDMKTGETLFVTNVNLSSCQITCLRDMGAILGSPPTAAVADVLKNIGPARELGGTSDEGRTTQKVVSENFCSFIRTPVEIDEHMMNTETYGEAAWDVAKFKAAQEHRWAIEHAICLSVRSMNDAGTAPGPFTDPITGTKMIYTTGGIRQHLKGNIFDLSGAVYGGQMTESFIDALGEQLSQNGGPERFVFGGLHIITAFTQPAKNRLVLNDSYAKYGIRLQEYTTSCGLKLSFVPHPKMFTGHGTVDPTYGTLASEAWIIDMDFLELVTMKNLDTKLYTGVGPTGIAQADLSGRKEEWRTTLGVRMYPGLDNPNNATTANIQYLSPHGKIIGFTSY